MCRRSLVVAASCWKIHLVNDVETQMKVFKTQLFSNPTVSYLKCSESSNEFSHKILRRWPSQMYLSWPQPSSFKLAPTWKRRSSSGVGQQVPLRRCQHKQRRALPIPTLSTVSVLISSTQTMSGIEADYQQTHSIYVQKRVVRLEKTVHSRIKIW